MNTCSLRMLTKKHVGGHPSMNRADAKSSKTKKLLENVTIQYRVEVPFIHTASATRPKTKTIPHLRFASSPRHPTNPIKPHLPHRTRKRRAAGLRPTYAHLYFSSSSPLLPLGNIVLEARQRSRDFASHPSEFLPTRANSPKPHPSDLI